jgi:hypothetical protein
VLICSKRKVLVADLLREKSITVLCLINQTNRVIERLQGLLAMMAFLNIVKRFRT